MNAAFEVSLKECVDLAMRGRSRAQKRFHRGIVAGLGVLMFVSASVQADGSAFEYLLAALLGLVVAGGAHAGIVVLDRWQIRTQVKPLLERHGRLTVEVELRDDGVFFRQTGADILIRWSEVKTAELGEDGVEIWSPEQLVGLVRDRGFDSEAEMVAFAEAVRHRAGAS